MIELLIQDHRAPSWNIIYAGVHYTKRKRIADTIHGLVRAEIEPDWPMFVRPVAITVEAHFKGKRALDPCNVPAKLYIDGLLGRLIEDDGPQFVWSVTTRSIPSEGKDYVIIRIEPA